MRATSVLAKLLGRKDTRVLGVEFVPMGIVLWVGLRTRLIRCSGCGCRVRRVYDQREREWRHLDLAGMQVWLRYRIRRGECSRCGVTTELVPWAEPRSRFTRDFEDMTAYLAQRTDQTTVSAMQRIAWETVGGIVGRVVERRGPTDRLDGLRNIGIDELSYRRHHEYVTVVVDHDRRCVVWAHPGKSADTLLCFFAELGPERTAMLNAVTLDMSAAYIRAVREAAPQARIVFDRFHVQRLAADAVDKVRRAQVDELKGSEAGRDLKRTRFALLKNPWNLSQGEQAKLSTLQKTNRRLYRAYMLKESLNIVLDEPDPNTADAKLSEWTSWAGRSRLRPFQKLAKTIRKYRDGILAYVETGFSNGRTEGLNGKIRTITRRAFGFHSVTNLIALIFLCCAGLTLSPVHRYPVLAPTTS